MSRLGYSHSTDWDPMKEDFDNSNYEQQYGDDDASDMVQLDHCRLYITNIPKGLNEDGLKSAFSKYGTMNEVYLSKDPLKRYALVCFETPGEAKHAMMKLNRTEPLRLTIHVAHKKKTDNRRPRERRERDEATSNGGRERNSNRGSTYTREHRDDASVGSRGRSRCSEQPSFLEKNTQETQGTVDITKQ